MPITSIWPIKGNYVKALDYIANPEKTEAEDNGIVNELEDVLDYVSNGNKTNQKYYVTGINCNPDKAALEFEETKNGWKKTDGVLAFHAIQSFKPGEIDAAMTHKIGVELAEKMWGDRFEVVVCTHLDKDHPHNHFVVNSVSYFDGKKFDNNRKDYERFSSLSDDLAKQHGLSVIKERSGKGRHYAEWKADLEYKPTIRSSIKEDIDYVISSSESFREFEINLRKMGYEIKHGKHLAVKAPGGQRFIRLYKLSSTDDYSEEAIRERILEKSHKIVKICIAVMAAAVLLGICFFVILPYLRTGKSDVLPAANHYEETMPEKNPEIPEYTGEAVTVINENEPSFTEYPEVTETYLRLSEFDAEGRCGTAEALLGPETLPDQPRGPIGMIRPTGWKTVRYDDLIEDKYLYNRCHLIAYELCGDNDPRQLITGTRYMNIVGMLAYENMTADYIRSTGNHVLYRSVPVFIDDELVCRGVLLEAVSIEDHGEGLKFCVFCHNVQPGVEIEYLTGDSCRTEEITRSEPAETDYIINIRTLRFHYPDCDGVKNMKEKNKKAVHADRETLIQEGYIPCGSCNP